MKKRDVFLFLSFAALFVLFAIFQNFSFPIGQLQQLNGKKFFDTKLHKFIPGYAFKNYIGQTIEAPYGYKEEISRRIASEGQPVIFDDKKFIKEELKSLPVYRNLKDLIDVDNNTPSEAGTNCVDNPVESQNNCFTEYEPGSSSSEKTGSVKVKTNPLRQTASINVSGEIESKMMYDHERNSVNVQFKKGLGSDSDLKVELDSEKKSGIINIDVRW